ncbi:hypothetical protein BH18THE1_BH18THE1_04350 [soil metagenome]
MQQLGKYPDNPAELTFIIFNNLSGYQGYSPMLGFVTTALITWVEMQKRYPSNE